MRGQQRGRTVLDIVHENKHGELILDLALVLVYVSHDLFERGDRLCQQLMVSVCFGCFFENVVEEEQSAR